MVEVLEAALSVYDRQSRGGSGYYVEISQAVGDLFDRVGLETARSPAISLGARQLDVHEPISLSAEPASPSDHTTDVANDLAVDRAIDATSHNPTWPDPAWPG